jgi:hypothetical protein
VQTSSVLVGHVSATARKHCIFGKGGEVVLHATSKLDSRIRTIMLNKISNNARGRKELTGGGDGLDERVMGGGDGGGERGVGMDGATGKELR